jgi:hypothetical protein
MHCSLHLLFSASSTPIITTPLSRSNESTVEASLPYFPLAVRLDVRAALSAANFQPYPFIMAASTINHNSFFQNDF